MVHRSEFWNMLTAIDLADMFLSYKKILPFLCLGLEYYSTSISTVFFCFSLVHVDEVFPSMSYYSSIIVGLSLC